MFPQATSQKDGDLISEDLGTGFAEVKSLRFRLTGDSTRAREAGKQKASKLLWRPEELVQVLLPLLPVLLVAITEIIRKQDHVGMVPISAFVEFHE